MVLSGSGGFGLESPGSVLLDCTLGEDGATYRNVACGGTKK